MAHVKLTVGTSFHGWHKYPKAPAAVAFLRNFHRHDFKVHLTVKVEGTNRTCEFFTLQAALERAIAELFSVIMSPQNEIAAGARGELSCEGMAQLICQKIGPQVELMGGKIVCVIVSEDGENDGAYYPE